jgi:hypothetical protein
MTAAAAASPLTANCPPLERGQPADDGALGRRLPTGPA